MGDGIKKNAEVDGKEGEYGERASDKFVGSTGVLFEQAMAQTRMAVCLTDPTQDDNPIVFANRAFRELTGYDEQEVIGKNCRFLQGPKTDPAAVTRLRDAIEKQSVVVVELLNYRKDGTPFWNALHLGPIFNEDGTVKYFFGSQWDVTDVHAARADEAHARMLTRELSHRMKNMFSVISALVTMNGRMDGTEASAERVNGRIRALGRAHEAMLDLAIATDRSTDITPTIKRILGPYLNDDLARLSVSANNVMLNSNAVSMLGLVLHELATNAIKYGALANDEGRLSLSWRTERREGKVRQPIDMLILKWEEVGGAPIDPTPAVSGAGSEIVAQLLKAAGGSIAFERRSTGLCATVELPVSSRRS